MSRLSVLRQDGYAVRLDWGTDGARETARGARYAVVVDVLSFTTTVSVAVDAGMCGYPYRWGTDDAEAVTFARSRDARLAVGRSQAREGEVSLSPASVAGWTGIERLVLPSPNGSTIAHQLAATGALVLAGCLRNRRTVAQWLLGRAVREDAVCIVAAGERWPDDGALRPAVEDLWGAGALVAALQAGGMTAVSPEAGAAAAAFRAVEERLEESLLASASGRELVAAGFRRDVAIAAELDGASSVPLLGQGGAFEQARRDRSGG